MPLISGFQATTVWKAFLLNSIVAALTVVMAVIIKGRFDTYIDKRGNKVIHKTNMRSILLTLGVAFLTSFVAYTVMHELFGFGRGMLAEN